jgi:hypothetical protein
MTSPERRGLYIADHGGVWAPDEKVGLRMLSADECAERLNALPLAEPLGQEVGKLVEAVQPFVARLVDVGEDESDEDTFSNSRSPYSQSPTIKVGDFRRLAAALSRGPGGEIGSGTSERSAAPESAVPQTGEPPAAFCARLNEDASCEFWIGGDDAADAARYRFLKARHTYLYPEDYVNPQPREFGLQWQHQDCTIDRPGMDWLIDQEIEADYRLWLEETEPQATVAPQTLHHANPPAEASPASVGAGGEETAWLIEETWSGYIHYIDQTFDAEKWSREAASLRELPYEWIFNNSGGATLTRRRAKIGFITKDDGDAMRFPSREAAEAWIAAQPNWFNNSDQFQAREHMWFLPSAPVVEHPAPEAPGSSDSAGGEGR